MSISGTGIGIGIGATRVFGSGEAVVIAVISGTGLVNGEAVPGQEANVTATISDGTTVTGYAWTGYANASDVVGTSLGTGANPTDYSAFEFIDVTLQGAGGPYTSARVEVQRTMLVNAGFRVNEGLRVNG